MNAAMLSTPPDSSFFRRTTPNRCSVRVCLFMLVCACIVPAVLVATGLVYQNYDLQRDRIARDAIVLARNFAVMLDREFAGVESGLRVLATSPDLVAGDLARFHQRATDALKYQIVNNYVLTDRSGRQLLNTLQPFGKPLPTTGTPAAVQQVFATGNPVLTDLFIGAVTQVPMIAMGVPVYRNGEIVYALNTGITPDRLLTLLNRQSLPNNWIVSVLDGNGSYVARTRDQPAYVGLRGDQPLLDHFAAAREGIIERETRERMPVWTAFSRLSHGDWTAAVSAPRAELTVALYRSLAWLVGGVALALALATWFAIQLSHRISSSVRGLIAPAMALGSGEPVVLPTMRLREAEAVGEAIQHASRMLAHAEHMAHHDVLTGLSNRLLFDELASRQIAVARRQGKPLAMLAIDLDEFKAVNDLHGHAAGDLVLKIASERIVGSIRASDIAARMGGDEFAVLLQDVDAHGAELLADKLVGALSAPYPNVLPTVSASIGIALFPQGGDTADALLARADRALYQAKQLGKCRFAVAG